MLRAKEETNDAPNPAQETPPDRVPRGSGERKKNDNDDPLSGMVIRP